MQKIYFVTAGNAGNSIECSVSFAERSRRAPYFAKSAQAGNIIFIQIYKSYFLNKNEPAKADINIITIEFIIILTVVPKVISVAPSDARVADMP